MKMQIPLFTLLTAVMMSVSGHAADAQEDPVRAVEALVAAYNAARDAKDSKAIETLFTDDADQLVSSGEWRLGKEKMVAGMLKSSQANPGDRTLTVERLRFPTADVALADARYEIADADGGKPRRMWSTFVAVKTANGWRLTAIRNMMPTR